MRRGSREGEGEGDVESREWDGYADVGELGIEGG
jgi:hypothetical protein